MSALDNNFDSAYDSGREMSSRASWLDNASANMYSDNSFFREATSRPAPDWLGSVELFDSGARRAVAAEEPAGETPPVENPHTKDLPAEPPVGETPPVEQPPVEEPPHPPVGTKPVETLPAETPPVEEPKGPRVATGPIPPEVAAGIKTLRGNGLPPGDYPTLPYTSRAEKREWEAKQRAELIAQQQAAMANQVDPGPGPDGRNADGTYGAGHHPYTPPIGDNQANQQTTDYYEQMHKKRMEEPTPEPAPTPRRAPSNVAMALAEAAKRMGLQNQTHEPREGGMFGKMIAHADPNYVPSDTPGGGRTSRG